MKSEGVAMIYDTMDNLHTPVKNSWTEKLDKLETMIDRLIRACQTWEEKERLARDALAVACVEIERILLKYTGGEGCPICYFTEPINDCNDDCPVCLAQYFLGRVKAEREAEENNRIVRDEQDGRKAMDAEDQKKEMKGGMNT